ncbi:MAG: hypothetical protein A3A87_02570 [Candidatus Muproteobacteria bacterium RIFCSPLOWO2_01_FULL_60_18]|uniref:Uncharacterized protein n=1 Tax=Candidatus Muproteobacteria bacterium RIFCSPLOWO2_01_FULL_60_18 TaxID=1817768 RepID=A0A1F6U603_9PROT|nr:MAG: hypothetical protein A2W42_00125 [Candidatus Muproteobacteria bacterium RIFCSPHIGHO2_01_60_12]OGI52784.1 MAG: hypothetical protein A3A87_02570 [Candidatus Muproteobacteria bacterium RIFCSPLOWO2_01_FULL_60_18]
MISKAKGNSSDMDKVLKELRNIKNLLMLSALRAGATSDEVNYATGMGAANIRAMFPVKRGRKNKG